MCRFFYLNIHTLLVRLFKDHGELLQYPRRRRERQRENVTVFGATNVEAFLHLIFTLGC